MKQKLVSLLFALAFAQYAPAQAATSVDLVGFGGTFALPIFPKWFAEYGTSNQTTRGTQKKGIGHRRKSVIPN